MEWMDRLTTSWVKSHPDWDFSGLPSLVRLTRLAVLMTEFQVQALLPYGLTPSDYSVLAALRRSGGPNRLAPSELYSVLEVSSGGMTKMIKRLEVRGLVERSPDPDDGRSNLVHLTAEGRKLEEEAFTAYFEGAKKLLHPLDAGQHKSVDRSLEQLLDCFEKYFYV